MLRMIGDFPLEELKNYKPDLTRESDFHEFWENMLGFISSSVNAEITWVPYPVDGVRVGDVTITSWDGTPLRAWYIVPNKGKKKHPTLLHFHGYTDSRGQVHQYLKWALQGIAVISFEVRGQGFSPDYARYPNGTQIQGWMTLGLEEKEKYYYANVYRDVLACVDWAFQLDEVHEQRVGVFGESQGAALSIVAAALRKNICLVMADYPFLAHFERAIQIAGHPYSELLYYFKYRDPEMNNYKKVMSNLSYFDVMNFCPLVTCPTLFAIGLEDNVTPPSTVFAAYNHLGSRVKEIKIYPEYGHELISFHEEERLKFVAETLLRSQD